MDGRIFGKSRTTNPHGIDRRELLRRSAVIGGAGTAAMALSGVPVANGQGAESTPPAEAPKSGGTLIVAKTAEVPGLDPHLSASTSYRRIYRLFYNNLVRLAPDLSVEPDLAESWEVIDDTQVVFKLRQGVMWHPPVSRELDAEDVKYSLDRMFETAANTSAFESIDEIEAVDKYTVALHLKYPHAGLVTSLGELSSPAIVNRETVEEHGDLRSVAVGTGPFIVESWQPEVEMRLRKNPDYFVEGLPYLDEVILRIIPDESNMVAGLRTDDIHHAILENNPNYELLQDTPNLVPYRTARLGADYVNINHEVAPFENPLVSQAMSWAINRQEILQFVTQGYASLTAPATPPMELWNLPEDQWMRFYEPDVERARELLAEAGHPDGFSTTLSVIPTLPTMVAAAPVIQAQLAQVGIDVEIENVEYAQWIERFRAKDFAMTLNLMSGFADPDGMFYRLFHSEAENPNNWHEPEVDALLEEGRTTFDYDQRKDIYDQVQLLMLERVPQLWLFSADLISFAQDYVKGYVQYPTAELISYERVWLDQ